MGGPITGKLGAFQQPANWGRNESGNWTTLSFEGNRREVSSLTAAYAQIPGLTYTVTESFGKLRLEVNIPWNTRGIDPRTDLVEKWELFSSDVEKDLLSSSVPTRIIDNLSAQQIEHIRFLIDQPPDPANPAAYPKQADFVLDGTDGSNGLNAYAVWLRMVKGVRSFPVSPPILRRTRTTSIQFAVPYALTNVDKIFTTATLQTVELVPSSLLFNLPFNANPPDNLLAYGWRKKFPTVQEIALLKWQIVQEFYYGLWDQTFWGAPL